MQLEAVAYMLDLRPSRLSECTLLIGVHLYKKGNSSFLETTCLVLINKTLLKSSPLGHLMNALTNLLNCFAFLESAADHMLPE